MQTTTNQKTPWMTRAELASHYRISKRTVDSWTASKKIPFRKIGRRILFNIEQVEAAMVKCYDAK